MKKQIYYHAYLDDLYYWTSIFTEQMTLMEKNNLLQQVDLMKITAISKADERTEIFHKLCAAFPVKIQLEFVENKFQDDFDMLKEFSQLQGDKAKPFSETHTIAKLYDDCQKEDLHVLYIHTKAVTAISNCLLTYKAASKFKNRHLWRQLMNWGVINNWQKCVDSLSQFDTAGIDYQSDPPHYKGNFWWTKSEHVRSLAHPMDDNWWIEFRKSARDPWIQNLADRFRNEFWVCSKPNTKAFNVRANQGYYVENDI